MNTPLETSSLLGIQYFDDSVLLPFQKQMVEAMRMPISVFMSGRRQGKTAVFEAIRKATEERNTLMEPVVNAMRMSVRPIYPINSEMRSTEEREVIESLVRDIDVRVNSHLQVIGARERDTEYAPRRQHYIAYDDADPNGDRTGCYNASTMRARRANARREDILRRERYGARANGIPIR